MLDREISDPARFHASKGIDPWTKYQLSLLPDTDNIRVTANANLLGIAANNAYYVCDGTTIAGSANLSSFTTVTGTPGVAAVDITTNGGLVWTAHTASGIYQTNGSVATSYVTGTVSHLGYVKGRLLASHNQALYNPIAAGALPAAFYTQPDTGFTWATFAEGNAFIYAAGGVGDRSWIYRIAVQTDGVGLSAPVVAATLPTGERVRSMLGYLGYIVIGTDKGVRFATASDSGDLTLGALIPTPGAVYSIEASDRFVWFGWTNYDTTSTGLGRFDLTAINEGLAPAYASDLMATAQGAVRGIGSVGGRLAFAVDAVGFFAESDTEVVTSGFLSTGQITYGISDAKVPVLIDLKHAPLPVGTSVTVAMSSDRGGATVVGTSSTPDSVSPTESISTGSRRSEENELVLTLLSAAGLAGPVLTRWTLLAYPAPQGASTYTLPLILAPTVVTYADSEVSFDPWVEYGYLRELHTNRELTTVQIGQDSFEGTLEEYVWIPDRHSYDRQFWSGTFVAKFRRIRG